MKNGKQNRMISNGKVNRIISLLFAIIILGSAQINPIYAAGNARNAKNNNSITLNKSIVSGELEQFTNDMFDKYMKEYNIPGAVISIVKDGNVVLSKGYGYADLEQKTPVIPSETKFRIGSTTKLFTATAVMQLVDEGKIDMEQDVNTYLKEFRIKNRFPDKVTMAQLLTHTSGIDSDIINDLSEKKSEVKPLAQFLKKRMLPVIRKPGQIIEYSSYGIALAGCIVEETSGMSCDGFIDKNIVEPLDMKNTSFEFNPPGLSKGYLIENGALKNRELKGYFNLYPVGGMVSTAEDMAKFMIAHLNNGEYNGKHIMKNETSINMHSRHAGLNPTVPGTCYGFAEGFRNGKRTIGHPGYSADGVSTELCLIPEENVGIFLSVNQGANNYFPQDFINYFIDHYYPAKENSNTSNNKLTEPIDINIAGTYRFGEYTRSTIIKGDIFGNGEDIKVSIDYDNTLRIEETDSVTGKKTITKAVQDSPMIFKSSEGNYYVFKQNSKGEVAYMAQTSDSWHGTYERIHWYDENSFQIGLFLGCCVIFMIEILLFSILTIKKMIKRKEVTNSPQLVKHLNSLIVINSLLNLAFFGISMMTWGDRLRYGVPIDIKILLIIPIISCLITIALTVGTMIAWRKSAGSLMFRINSSILALVNISFIWFYNYYNFIGFKY